MNLPDNDILGRETLRSNCYSNTFRDQSKGKLIAFGPRDHAHAQIRGPEASPWRFARSSQDQVLAIQIRERKPRPPVAGQAMFGRQDDDVGLSPQLARILAGCVYDRPGTVNASAAQPLQQSNR